MFHAVIRDQGGALHLIADVDPYNLETLRQHVAQSMREAPPVHLRIDVQQDQHQALDARLRRWVKRITRSGAEVEIVASHPDTEKRTV
jgi:hypothetical protein